MDLSSGRPKPESLAQVDRASSWMTRRSPEIFGEVTQSERLHPPGCHDRNGGMLLVSVVLGTALPEESGSFARSSITSCLSGYMKKVSCVSALANLTVG
jgi:hypothetical protein